MQDVTKFYLLSGLVQLIIYLVSLVRAIAHSDTSASNASLELLVAMIDAFRPVLPAVLVFVRITALIRLRYQGVIVSDTQKMMRAGHIDVVLFDKTGTLTAEQVSKLPCSS